MTSDKVNEIDLRCSSVLLRMLCMSDMVPIFMFNFIYFFFAELRQIQRTTKRRNYGRLRLGRLVAVTVIIKEPAMILKMLTY